MTIAPMVLSIVGGTAPGFIIESESKGKMADGGEKVQRIGAPGRTWNVEKDEKKGRAVGEVKSTGVQVQTYAALYVPFAPVS
jgi:hypothetical protein